RQRDRRAEGSADQDAGGVGGGGVPPRGGPAGPEGGAAGDPAAQASRGRRARQAGRRRRRPSWTWTSRTTSRTSTPRTTSWRTSCSTWSWAQARLARDRGAAPGPRRAPAGGSAPASVSGESPGPLPRANAPGTLSCSCGSSPARSLTRSSTYTKLSEPPPPQRSSGQDSGFACGGDGVPSRAQLLLEAAFLSEETASLLSSYSQSLSLSTSLRLPCACACERLAAGEPPAPCPCAPAGPAPPCLSHHHLCVHPLREAGIQTESCGAATAGGCCHDLDTIAEQRTFRSQACSPTSTWEEEPDSAAATVLSAVPSLARSAAEDLETPEGSDEEPPPTPAGGSGAVFWAEEREEVDGGAEEAGAADPDPSLEQAHTSQPRSSASPEAVAVQQRGREGGGAGGGGAAAHGEAPGCDQVQRSYWSRHFWVDLLAVAVPMVPTVAWLCRGPARGPQPIYHF
ncbi:unnamed protein product, partial [Tetraodon nigroviridis]